MTSQRVVNPEETFDQARATLLLELLECGHEIRWTAIGDSMWPSLLSGDQVVIMPLPPQEVKRGEIGLFILHQPHEQPRWVLHRVIKHDRIKKILYTRGDHLPRADTPRHYQEWRGVLKLTYPALPLVQDGEGRETRLIKHSLHQSKVRRSLTLLGAGILMQGIKLVGKISRRAHHRDARGRIARSLGLTLLTLYAIYHRAKVYLRTPSSPR